MAKVDFITSNEQYVRLEIFEGRLPIDKAGEELLRLERCQRQAERARYEQIIESLTKTLKDS